MTRLLYSLTGFHGSYNTILPGQKITRLSFVLVDLSCFPFYNSSTTENAVTF